MKTPFKLILFLAISLLISCDNNDEIINRQEPGDLIGYWSYPEYAEDSKTLKFKRVDSFDQEEHSIHFDTQNLFIEKKNSSWCGTPPIMYKNYEGEWTMTNSIISVNVGFWGGTADYSWKLISVDSEYLTLEVLEIKLHENY